MVEEFVYFHQCGWCKNWDYCLVYLCVFPWNSSTQECHITSSLRLRLSSCEVKVLCWVDCLSLISTYRISLRLKRKMQYADFTLFMKQNRVPFSFKAFCQHFFLIPSSVPRSQCSRNIQWIQLYLAEMFFFFYRWLYNTIFKFLLCLQCPKNAFIFLFFNLNCFIYKTLLLWIYAKQSS